jgi:hypothetical protein
VRDAGDGTHLPSCLGAREAQRAYGPSHGVWTCSLDIDGISNLGHLSMLDKCHAAVVTFSHTMAPEVLHFRVCNISLLLCERRSSLSLSICMRIGSQ